MDEQLSSERQQHPSPDQWERYFSGSMLPEDRARHRRHIDSCPECREQAAAETHLGPLLSNLFTEPLFDDWESLHISDDQRNGYVDDALDEIDMQIVEGHLEFCTTCRAEVERLKAFREVLSLMPEQEVEAPSLSFWQRIRERLRFPARASVATHPVAGESGVTSRTVRRPPVDWGFALRTVTTCLVVAVAAFSVGVMTQKSKKLSGNVERSPGDVRVTVENSKPINKQIAHKPENKPLIRTRQDELDNPNFSTPTEQIEPRRSEESETPAKDKGSRLPHDRSIKTGVDSYPVDSNSLEGLLARTNIPDKMLVRRLPGIPSDEGTRGSTDKTVLLDGPVDSTVLSATPLLRWKRYTGADDVSYRIHLYLAADKSQLDLTPENMTPTKDTEWQVSTPLQRDTQYRWYVDALFKQEDGTDGAVRSQQTGMFRVADALTVARVAKKQCEAHLALGAFYAGENLLFDARREFQAVVDTGVTPELTARAKKLLARLNAPAPASKP